MITVDMNKAKIIAHDARRAARNAAFAPLDIKATIPAESEAAEAARATIRSTDAALQVSMDAASDADALKALMPSGEQTMTKSATREAADKVSAPVASPVFTGNVGVGVTPETWQSGWSALQIGGLTSYYAPTTTSASQSLMINNNAYNDGAWKYLITDEASSYYQLHGGHTFRVAPSGTADTAISWTTAMTIANSGNVLIGGGVAATGRLYLGAETGTAWSVRANANDYNDGSGSIHLNAQTTASRTLMNFYVTNGAVGSIVTSGSSTSYNTSSDYRLKTDVQPMTGATDRVKLLKPCNFEWISDGTRVDGFLAHEAQEVVPEAVHGTKDAMMDEEYEVTAATDTEAAVMGTRSVPDLQGIDQSKLVPLLTATIQELIARIEALEA